MPRLCHQDSLAHFWSDPTPVDRKLFLRFQAYLLRVNQLNACSASQHAHWYLFDRLPDFIADDAVIEDEVSSSRARRRSTLSPQLPDMTDVTPQKSPAIAS